MAPLAKNVCIFLLVVFFSSVFSEARLSKFGPLAEAPILAPSISPAPTPISNEISFAPIPPIEVPAPTPMSNGISFAPIPPVEVPAPAPAPIESSDNPYGLYGGVSTVSPTKKTTATTTNTILGNQEDEIPVEEINSERLAEYNAGNHYSTGYPKVPNNYNNNGYSNNYNNNGYSNNYNNNGYSNNYYNNNGYSNNYNSNNGYSNNYNNNNGYSNSGYENNNNGYTNSYVNEKQGMSDTRFLENGKYYHDVNNENHFNQNGYESVKENNNSENYYGNGERSKYEFDSMEEYEKQQGYPDTEKYYNFNP